MCSTQKGGHTSFHWCTVFACLEHRWRSRKSNRFSSRFQQFGATAVRWKDSWPPVWALSVAMSPYCICTAHPTWHACLRLGNCNKNKRLVACLKNMCSKAQSDMHMCICIYHIFDTHTWQGMLCCNARYCTTSCNDLWHTKGHIVYLTGLHTA